MAHKQSREEAHVYEALLRISRAVQEMERASDLGHAVQVFYAQLKALGLNFCALSLHRVLDENERLFENHLVKPDGQYSVTTAVRRGLYQEWKAGEIVYRPDLVHDSTVIAEPGYLERLRKEYGVPLCSLLHVPHVGGMLTLRSTSVDPFSSADIELIHRVSEVLSMLAVLFRKNYPEKLSNIRKAIDARDADALAEAGHSAKSMVSNFAAQKCFETARHLEMLGKAGDFDEAESTYMAFDRALSDLDAALPGA